VSDLAKDLNPEQLKAVKIDRGPILILAGAGSGKTRVITYRIAYLINERKVSPRNILAVTFTNKAADEMKSRLARMLDQPGSEVWVKTFHATCAAVLRESAHRIGIPRNFVIYDESDQLAVVKDCLKEMKIESRELKPEFVLKMISHAKENLITPEDNHKLVEYNALDFDDLIFMTVRLFQADPSVLQRYQERFHYILVDEYQDTNRAQYVLTQLLAQKYRNLCVVGDDDQSIYSWRGAEIRNILDFEQDYPDTAVIKLEQNYRSTKTILQAASAVVRHNAQRKVKTLWCENEAGEKIEYFEAYDDKNEANYVVKKVIEQSLAGSDLGQIAVFYRLNYQSRVFEEFFVKYKVPYEVVGALKFYDRAEVKNILAYLKVISNPRDLVSLKRVVNLPIRGIGFESLERIGEFAGRERIPFFDALRKSETIEGLKSRTRAGIRSFVELIEKFIALKDQVNPYELAIQVAKESGYLDSLSRDQTEEEYTRRKNVEQLLISINDFIKTFPEKRLDDYLENVMLRSNIDEWQGAGRVSLMTLHNAKGLEFDTVFITGLEDGILPHYRSYEENRYEEERRLFYVGITRARKKLFLTSASQRESYRGGFQVAETSPFLKEVPDDIFASALIPEDY
jgi:DNA helicase-2/ATP-dependent DNA helicase PcrA